MQRRIAAVTFGKGPRHAPLAQALARRWNQISRIQCYDISPQVPWQNIKQWMGFAKAWTWDCVPNDITQAIIIDADCFPVRPVSVGDIPDVVFAACTENPQAAGILKERKPDLWAGIERVFNSGVVIANRETRPLFDELKTMTRHPTRTRYEQNPFNWLIFRQYGGFTELPPEWNWRQHPAKKMGIHLDNSRVPFICHLAGIEDLMDLKVMYALCDDPAFKWMLRPSEA